MVSKPTISLPLLKNLNMGLMCHIHTFCRYAGGHVRHCLSRVTLSSSSVSCCHLGNRRSGLKISSVDDVTGVILRLRSKDKLK